MELDESEGMTDGEMVALLLSYCYLCTALFIPSQYFKLWAFGIIAAAFVSILIGMAVEIMIYGELQ